MYILTIEDNFSSAHQLRGYQGKCENMHGHNWKVILNVKGSSLNSIGLLIDFHDLKEMLKKICSCYDHVNINEISPFDEMNPSSENLARIIAEAVRKELMQKSPALAVHSITICESDTAKCTYLPE